MSSDAAYVPVEAVSSSIGVDSATRGLLKESLAAQLREEILTGGIAPGQKIIEGPWARQFKVAQVTVREALNILIAEGFVTKGHGHSARVLKLSDTDIIDLYHVRGCLEGLAARLVVEQGLPVDDLEEILTRMREAAEINDVRNLLACVQRFHICLLEKPGNPFLRETGRRLVIPLYAFTLMRALTKKLNAGPWASQLANHRRIIDAIRMRDPSLAEQAVIHVTNLFLKSALRVWAR